MSCPPPRSNISLTCCADWRPDSRSFTREDSERQFRFPAQDTPNLLAFRIRESCVGARWTRVFFFGFRHVVRRFRVSGLVTRRFTRRGPVWRCAVGSKSMRRARGAAIHFGFPRPVSLTVRPCSWIGLLRSSTTPNAIGASCANRVPSLADPSLCHQGPAMGPGQAPRMRADCPLSSALWGPSGGDARGSVRPWGGRMGGIKRSRCRR